jgi:hypothetical protein
MSKKLIAVATAAALALTGLVATSSVAAVGPFDVLTTQADTRSLANTNGSTGDLEHTILVPSQDVVRFNDMASSTTGTLLRYKVVTPTASAAIAVSASTGTKLVTQAQVTAGSLTTASGASTLSITSDATGDATFYAYTTSTSDSTITVSSAGASEIVYLKGTSDIANAYKIAFTASSATSLGGDIEVSGTVSDMFGNKLTPASTDINTNALGGSLTAGAATEVDFAVNATTKVVSYTVTASTTASTVALSIALATPATAVTALGARTTSQFFTVSVNDLTAQVTALTAQVAALTADYNALATKYNKLVKKSKRVAKK